MAGFGRSEPGIRDAIARAARGEFVRWDTPLFASADGSVSIIIDASLMASPLPEQRNHTLKMDVPRRGLRVDSDTTRLAQVISNLLTNAAKYTPPNGVVTVC